MCDQLDLYAASRAGVKPAVPLYGQPGLCMASRTDVGPARPLYGQPGLASMASWALYRQRSTLCMQAAK